MSCCMGSEFVLVVVAVKLQQERTVTYDRMHG